MSCTSIILLTYSQAGEDEHIPQTLIAAYRAYALYVRNLIAIFCVIKYYFVNAVELKRSSGN